MLFNSYSFILFFVVVLILHSLPFSWHTKKINLLLASYIFYAAWNPPFVVLLWISTIADWVLSRHIHKTDIERHRKILLFMSLLVNLGMLAFFKYGVFILDSFISILKILGILYAPAKPNIILPVGISFYTFQTLSYTFDVYRGKFKPWNSFLDYALYVTFFPQLVAGPIVRAFDFLPQCKEEKKLCGDKIGWGISLLICGLFLKSVFADLVLSDIVENVFDYKNKIYFLDAWLGTFAFSLQIFCDFSGYSLCAIGIAMCLGFELPDNFLFPYGAIGFSDFWRRWHISLSTWLRDYLYISLGGNRGGNSRTYFNIITTMLIGGLWHGASWMFVIWGGLHGLYIVVERYIKNYNFTKIQFWRKWWVQLGLSFLTFIMVSITWVFFRAENLGQAFQVIHGMLRVENGICASNILEFREQIAIVILVPLFLAFHWIMREKTIEELANKVPWKVRSMVLACLAYAVLTSVSSQDRSFIYFQF